MPYRIEVSDQVARDPDKIFRLHEHLLPEKVLRQCCNSSDSCIDTLVYTHQRKTAKIRPKPPPHHTTMTPTVVKALVNCAKCMVKC